MTLGLKPTNLLIKPVQLQMIPQTKVDPSDPFHWMTALLCHLNDTQQREQTIGAGGQPCQRIRHPSLGQLLMLRLPAR